MIKPSRTGYSKYSPEGLNHDGNQEIISIISSRLSWELSRRELNFQRTDTDSMLPVIKLPGYNHQFMHEKKEISGVLYSQIKNLIGEHTGSGSEKKIIQMTNAILSQMRLDEDKLNFMRSIKSTKKWNELLSSWTVSDSDFIFLSGLIDLFSIIENSFMINNKLGSCFKNVRYIAPLRASTERYYRYQDLSVDEIDHKGENIGMFLSNIPKKWRDGLDDWTSNNLGFKIKEQMTSSHIAIKLEYGDESVLDNIADMGFGFSQIMPIVVQLWSVASGYEANIKGFNVDPYIFAIEQPELHLHPKMQASLAVLFSRTVELAKENKIDLRLIIETHSNSMISKLGDLIIEGSSNKEDVNVMLFEQNRKERRTQLSYSTFNDEGMLENWPTGFFSY